MEQPILWEKNHQESELVRMYDDIASDGQEMYVQMGKD